MKIAVIGAGVSGLTAAYLLSRRHEVEVFERNSYAGGHANTVVVEDERGNELPLDVGFIVYSERTYTYFSRLLRELRVPTQPSEMSFSVSWENDSLEFSSRGLLGYLASPRNLFRLSHHRMLYDVVRFQREARRAVAEDRLHDVTFAEYLERGRYSDVFKYGLIVPLTASTWSNSPADVLGFPAHYLFRFLAQHGVLAPRSIPEWRWIVGGSRTYVRRIVETLPEGALHLDADVRGIRRDRRGGATVCLNTGELRRFDAVVMACHPDEALQLLEDPSREECEGLGGFTYARNRVVLHTDERYLPRHRHARAAWNYRGTRRGTGAPDVLTMTYDLNRLQRIEATKHYLVSVNPRDVRADAVLASFDYAHPVYSMRTLEAQRAIAAMSGQRCTYFAGAYLGYGFHEDGARSGVEVARKLGVEW